MAPKNSADPPADEPTAEPGLPPVFGTEATEGKFIIPGGSAEVPKSDSEFGIPPLREASPASPTPPDPAASNRRTLIIGALFTVVAVILAGTGVVFWLSQGPQFGLQASPEITSGSAGFPNESPWEVLETEPGSGTWATPSGCYASTYFAQPAAEDFADSRYSPADPEINSGISQPRNDAQATKQLAIDELGLFTGPEYAVVELDPIRIDAEVDSGTEPVELAVYRVDSQYVTSLVAMRAFDNGKLLLFITYDCAPAIGLSVSEFESALREDLTLTIETPVRSRP